MMLDPFERYLTTHIVDTIPVKWSAYGPKKKCEISNVYKLLGSVVQTPSKSAKTYS